MKFAIGVVIYNPSKSELEAIRNIFISLKWERCFVYDNSPISHGKIFDKVDYFWNIENVGLPKAYNLFMRECQVSKIDYLCLMDQDSEYSINEIKKMIKKIVAIRDLEMNLNDVIIAPRSYCLTSERIERSDKFTYQDVVINSGMFINIMNASNNKIYFDENLFLDGVDIDFCKNIKKLGGEIYIYENSILFQNLGDGIKNGKFCSHSAIRYRDICRSNIYIEKKYNSRGRGWLKGIFKCIKTFIKILFYEVNRIEKIEMTLLGMVDGMKMKSGKEFR